MKKTKMLKKNYEFKKVLSKGRHYSGKNVDIVILKNNNKSNFLGIAVSTKVGKAVTRNKIKRLIRENFYNIEEKIKEGNSIIILWKKNIDTQNATYSNIKADMFELMNRAKVLIEENVNEENNNKNN